MWRKENTVADNVNKSKFIDLELLDQYDKLIAKSEQEQRESIEAQRQQDLNSINKSIEDLTEQHNKDVDEINNSIDVVANAIPLKRGEGRNSLIQKTNSEEPTNIAITDNSVAIGIGTIAGAKGYYFTEIFYGDDSTLPQIKLSTEQPVETGLHISPKALVENSVFETPMYVVGDKFSLICNDHFVLFGTITNISHDIITFEGDFERFKSGLANQVSAGNAAMNGEYYVNLVPNYDDYTLCVNSKPLNGIVAVCENAFASGCGSISAGEEGTAQGAYTTVVGAYGHASGCATVAGYAAHAEGQYAEAIGLRSHAEGFHTIASGMAAHAEGSRALVNNEIIKVIASGMGAHAEGSGTHATEPAAHAEGSVTEATATAAHAEGIETTASEEAAHAEGYLCTASGKYSHAEGTNCTASGIAAHAEGNKSEASGNYSHAGGVGTKATYIGQYAIGRYNYVDDNALFIIGNGGSDSDRKNAFKVYNSGDTVVSGTLTAKKGIKSYVSAGQKAGTTLGSCATAEGNSTTASNSSAHAEGSGTTASGLYSHAEGNKSIASGSMSHAEGSNTQALHNYSHAGGDHTITSAPHQTVIGKYNTDNAKALFIIGDGASDTNRSNAFEIISKTVNGTKVRSFKLGDTEIMEEQLKKVTSLPSEIEKALDSIIAIQENLIGGTT